MSARKGPPSGPLPAFIEPQLSTLRSRPPAGADWGHEIKFDGYRMQIRVEAGTARLRTRNGADWTAKLPHLARAAAAFEDCIIDGELVALTDAGIPDFPKLQSTVSSRAAGHLVFYAFDLLFLGGTDLRKRPLRDRKAALAKLLGKAKDQATIRYAEHLEGDPLKILASACALNLEGIVSKRLDAPYASRRTQTWVKVKCTKTCHVLVGGWQVSGSGIRSLIAGAGKPMLYLGRLGTGLPASLTRWLLPRLKELETDICPFDPPPPKKRGRIYRWVKPELIAEIQFLDWTTSGRIRHGSIKGVYERKSIAKPRWIELPDNLR